MEPDLSGELKKMVSIYEDPTKLFDLMDIHGFILKSKKDYEFNFNLKLIFWKIVVFQRKKCQKPRKVALFAEKKQCPNRKMEATNPEIRPKGE